MWLAGLVLMALLTGGCNSLFFQPDNHFYAHPSQFGLTHREIHFKSGDGTALYGWFLQAKGPVKGTIVFFHGNAANISNHIYAVEWLPKRGYQVFIFDYRGYGLSEGTPDREGAVTDCAAAINTVRLQPGVNPDRLIVYGQSLGGALMIPALEGDGGRGVRAVVLESTFSSYREVVRLILDRHWLTWPLQYPLSWMLFTDELAPRDHLASLAGVPVLVVSRTGDPVVPFGAGSRLFDKIPGKDKTFWPVEGQGHIVTFTQNDPVWREKLLSWLEENLPSPTSP